MFQVSNNNEETITKKKKHIFFSTTSSNEMSSFEPKNSEKQKILNQSISKSLSLGIPTVSPKKVKKNLSNSKNYNESRKVLPMKRILFRLYRVNFFNSKKERTKFKNQNKKENNLKKNGNNNLKIKQRRLPTKNTNSLNNNNYSAGRWKSDEHQRFIDAIIIYGNNWRQVQKYVGTRSSTQTRSHAQKFFEKLKRSQLFKREKYDFSKNSLKILHDIMKNLPNNEYEQTLKALHSLSYEKNQNSQNEKNDNENNILNANLNNSNEKNNYDGNKNNFNNEENLKCIKFYNQGYCSVENNNKLFNNADYLFYNNSNNININSNNNYNNYLINDYLNNDNYDNKSFGREESENWSQRKNSLSEINLNIKESKEPNNNEDGFNLHSNLNFNLFNNNLNLNDQQDNKKNHIKIFENYDDKIDYKQQFTYMDFFFNPQNSRKMSFEEKI